jgi:hypothetical protein
MEKGNINKLINEESKRLMQISEYAFYTVTEAEEDDIDAELDDLESELPPADDAEPETQEEPIDDTGDEGGFGDEPMDKPAEEMGSDEVEVDVTDLVNTSNELKASADENSDKMSELIDNFTKLASQVNSMGQMSKKIDSLGSELSKVSAEIEKRNPTPTQKIEMRSLDSFPYNIKLSDFWSDNADKFTTVDSAESTVGGEEEEEEAKEYVLTKADASDFSSSDIKDSFGDFEEEDIE